MCAFAVRMPRPKPIYIYAMSNGHTNGVIYTSDSQRKSAFSFYMKREDDSKCTTLPLDTKHIASCPLFTFQKPFVLALSRLTSKLRFQCGSFVFNDAQYVSRSFSFELRSKKDCIVYDLFCILYSLFQVYLCVRPLDLNLRRTTDRVRQTRAVCEIKQPFTWMRRNECIVRAELLPKLTDMRFFVYRHFFPLLLLLLFVVVIFFCSFHFILFIFRTFYSYSMVNERMLHQFDEISLVNIIQAALKNCNPRTSAKT